MADYFTDIGSNLNQLNGVIQTLNRRLNDLGSSLDNHALRSELKKSRETGTTLVKNTSALLNKPYGDRNQKARYDKLQNQFKDLSIQFEKVAKATIQKEINSPLNQRDSFSSGSIPQGYIGGYQSQDLQQSQNVDDIIIEERNTQVKKLEKEMSDLLEAYKDLSQLVGEQGEALVQIDKTVDTTVVTTNEAVGELEKANKYVISYRKKLFFIAIGILIILAIIIAIIVSQVNKNKKN